MWPIKKNLSLQDGNLIQIVFFHKTKFPSEVQKHKLTLCYTLVFSASQEEPFLKIQDDVFANSLKNLFVIDRLIGFFSGATSFDELELTIFSIASPEVPTATEEGFRTTTYKEKLPIMH